MQGTTLSFSNIHDHGELFANILKARRPTQLPSDWDDAAAGIHDFDQYDTPQSRWLAMHDDDGGVLGSLRLTPTTAQSGVYSYMMRDAQNGLLEDVPTDLLFNPAPIEETTWEMTRAHIRADLNEREMNEVRGGLIAQMMKTAQTEGFERLVALMPESWVRLTEASEFSLEAAGRVWETKQQKFQAHWLVRTQPG